MNTTKQKKLRRYTTIPFLLDLLQSIKQCILKISPELKGKIAHSTLFDNSIWRNHFEENIN
jgi:hypothetical protein